MLTNAAAARLIVQAAALVQGDFVAIQLLLYFAGSLKFAPSVADGGLCLRAAI